MILYEYPFNERIRTYLRIEHLFRRFATLAQREAPVDHHHAITTLFEMMDVAARADLKSDVMKDLERQKSQLAAYRGNPGVAEEALDAILAQLDGWFAALNAQPGKAGQTLTEIDWLMGVRSRVGIPGGTCEFDLPAYYAWQHRDAERRRSDLNQWATTLAPLAESVHLLLRLLRESGAAQKVMASGGALQQQLPSGRSFQLLRMRLDPALELVPKISCNRLMVSVQLLSQDAEGRLLPVSDDVGFELTLC